MKSSGSTCSTPVQRQYNTTLNMHYQALVRSQSPSLHQSHRHELCLCFHGMVFALVALLPASIDATDSKSRSRQAEVVRSDSSESDAIMIVIDSHRSILLSTPVRVKPL